MPSSPRKAKFLSVRSAAPRAAWDIHHRVKNRLKVLLRNLAHRIGREAGIWIRSAGRRAGGSTAGAIKVQLYYMFSASLMLSMSISG
jgi:hypothetical protein